MINYDESLVRELNSILPTYFELFCDSSTETPCITYLQTGDEAYREGDHIRYSHVYYTIKVWANDLAIIKDAAGRIDAKMYELGFKRNSYNTLTYNQSIQAIIKYEGLGRD